MVIVSFIWYGGCHFNTYIYSGFGADFSVSSFDSLGFCGSSLSSRTIKRSRSLASSASCFPSIVVLADLGFYNWKPPSRPTKPLGQVTADDIRCGLVADDPVPQLVNLKDVMLPVSYQELEPQYMKTGSFPSQGGMAACLHVLATRGVNFGDIDFLIGGSVLAFLCGQGKKGAKYLAQMCPSTKMVIVSKHKTYTQNFGQRGFQFERLVTGQDMYGLHDLTAHEHLQLLRIGKFRVLATAEVDAVDDQGRPVELKSSNPRFFGIDTLLQMVSSGSQLLLHPHTTGLTVEKIHCIPMEQLASKVAEDVKETDRQIVAAFERLDASKESMTNERYSVLPDGRLRTAEGEALLPQQQVIEDLLKD